MIAFTLQRSQLILGLRTVLATEWATARWKREGRGELPGYHVTFKH